MPVSIFGASHPSRKAGNDTHQATRFGLAPLSYTDMSRLLSKTFHAFPTPPPGAFMLAFRDLRDAGVPFEAFEIEVHCRAQRTHGWDDVRHIVSAAIDRYGVSREQKPEPLLGGLPLAGQETPLGEFL